MKKLFSFLCFFFLCCILLVSCSSEDDTPVSVGTGQASAETQKITIATDTKEVWSAHDWVGDYYIVFTVEFENFDESPSELELITGSRGSRPIYDGKIWYYIGELPETVMDVQFRSGNVTSNIVSIVCHQAVDSGTIRYSIPESLRTNYNGAKKDSTTYYLNAISGESLEFFINFPEGLEPDEYVVVNMINNTIESTGYLSQRCAVHDGKITVSAKGEDVYFFGKDNTGAYIQGPVTDDLRRWVNNTYYLYIYYKGMRCLPAATLSYNDSLQMNWSGKVDVAGEIQASADNVMVKKDGSLEVSYVFKYFRSTPDAVYAHYRKADSDDAFSKTESARILTNNKVSWPLGDVNSFDSLSAGVYEFWFSELIYGGESNHIFVTITD